jgi:hypothetical protein
MNFLETRIEAIRKLVERDRLMKLGKSRPFSEEIRLKVADTYTSEKSLITRAEFSKRIGTSAAFISDCVKFAARKAAVHTNGISEKNQNLSPLSKNIKFISYTTPITSTLSGSDKDREFSFEELSFEDIEKKIKLTVKGRMLNETFLQGMSLCIRGLA